MNFKKLASKYKQLTFLPLFPRCIKERYLLKYISASMVSLVYHQRYSKSNILWCFCHPANTTKNSTCVGIN